jgi:hypothetical protein
VLYLEAEISHISIAEEVTYRWATPLQHCQHAPSHSRATPRQTSLLAMRSSGRRPFLDSPPELCPPGVVPPRRGGVS